MPTDTAVPSVFGPFTFKMIHLSTISFVPLSSVRDRRLSTISVHTTLLNGAMASVNGRDSVGAEV